MPLVNYSSSSDDANTAGPAGRNALAVKRRKKTQTGVVDASGKRPRKSSPPASDASENVPEPCMPPLPPHFHDLYAAPARQSTVDDPSLHQGRKRQTPHIVGQWPSHVYIEWRPSHEQHSALMELVAMLRERLSGEIELFQLVKSDLGAHLPLHVSLSRPLSLHTANKDDFLARISHSLGSTSVVPFEMQPRHLAWFTSPDSKRSFLVLGVATVQDESPSDRVPLNEPLMGLLRKCNAISSRFKQPLLYQEHETDDAEARDAFHISIAWTFAQPDQDLSQATLDLLQSQPLDEIMGCKIGVSSVKVKIGSDVTSIRFSDSGPREDKTRLLLDEP